MLGLQGPRVPVSVYREIPGNTCKGSFSASHRLATALTPNSQKMPIIATKKPFTSVATGQRQRQCAARPTSSCCRAVQFHQQLESAAGFTRRDLTLSAAALLLASQVKAAHAKEAADTAVAAAPAPAASSSTSRGAPSPSLEAFLDNEYELQVPSNYQYIATPIPVVERGPAPERSPVLARFEPPAGGPEVITIITRKASALKQTLLQVSDISQMGDPISVAKLILPRGSTLVASATQQVPQPPKQTPVGPVDIPPQTYYTYEFTTPAGFHVAMAAAAKKGSIVICGASTTAQNWSEAGPVFRKVVRSFRLRSQAAISQA